jgi:hypothetical protein
MDANVVAAIIGGIVGALTATIPVLYQAYKDKHNEPQDSVAAGLQASKEAVDTVITYSGELRKVRLEYETLRSEIVLLREERQKDKMLIAEWQYGIERLIAQITSLDHTPVWRPDVNPNKKVDG